MIAEIEVLRFKEKYPEMELVVHVKARLGRGGYAVIDATGEGAGVVSRSNELELDVRAFVAGAGSDARDASKLYGFVSQRPAAWCRFREALADPDSDMRPAARSDPPGRVRRADKVENVELEYPGRVEGRGRGPATDA